MPGGRRSLLEDEGLRERILQKVRFGVPAAIAAQSEGVGERTYYEWTAIGRDPKARGRRAVLATQFSQAIREAQGYAVSRVVLTHTQIALGQTVKREVRRVVLTDEGAHEEVIEREYHPPHPGALQWWLERRVPQHYAPIAVKDADTADPEEVVPPAAADEDPAAAADALRSLLDRYAPAAGEGARPPGGLPEARSD